MRGLIAGALVLSVLLNGASLWKLAAVEDQLRQQTERLATLERGLAASPAPVTSAGFSSAGAEVIGRVVSQAVLKNLQDAKVGVATSGPPKPEPTVEASPEQRANIEQARQILRAAIAAGQLRRQDVLEMRRLKLASGGRREFQELQQEIFSALNQQKMQAEDPAFVLP